MGRAGGGSRGGGGRRGSGGNFSRSGMSGSRRSSSSRSSGSRSSSSFGGSFGGSMFGGPSHRNHGPVFGGFGSFGSFGSGRKTIIINNSGNRTTNNNSGTSRSSSTYSSGNTAAAKEYTEPKPLTPEQKINRAERLASEARTARKSTMKMVLIAVILLAIGLFVSTKAKNDVFEKYTLSGTVDVGYVYDEDFLEGIRTREACEEFYKETGIPLFIYTVDRYNKSLGDCDKYTLALYDELFRDENHVLVAYYNSEDWWSWAYGEKASTIMSDSEIDDLIDEIDRYWYDEDLNNDELFAKGIKNYQKKLTSGDNGAKMFAGLLLIAGGVVLVVAVYNYISKGKEAKRYEEEAKTIRAEVILSQPLETFGDQEIEDLKDKYDNM